MCLDLNVREPIWNWPYDAYARQIINWFWYVVHSYFAFISIDCLADSYKNKHYGLSKQIELFSMFNLSKYTCFLPQAELSFELCG